MTPAEKLPQVFARYNEIGGVLQHTLFEDAEPDELTARRALLDCVPTLDRAGVARLKPRPIDRAGFLGSWCRPSDEALQYLGTLRTQCEAELDHPTFEEIGDRRVHASGFSMPGTPYGGEYAYAFTQTPYGMKASPREIQALFAEILGIILPRDEEAIILDWALPGIEEIVPFFSAGAEWWGVFLFTIQLPRIRKLTVIAGSTTD